MRSPNFAQLLVKFDPEVISRHSSKEDMVASLQSELDGQITGGKAAIKLFELADPADAPVVVRVSGEDLDRILQIAAELKELVSEIPGTINVTDDTATKRYEFAVNMDGDVATRMGISKYDVGRQINIALYGSKTSVFRRGGKEYNIVVKSDIGTKEQLENLAIKSKVAGNKVLLKQFARIGLEPQIEDIRRYARDRSVSVVADVKPGYSSLNIENYIERRLLPGINRHGVEVHFDGEQERIRKNFGNVGISSIFAIIAVSVMSPTPLIVSKSAMFTPMSIALLSGLVAVTFLTMVVVPVVYATINKST